MRAGGSGGEWKVRICGMSCVGSCGAAQVLASDGCDPSAGRLLSALLDRSADDGRVIAETVAICKYLYKAFRFGAGLALFKGRVRCLPDAVEGPKVKGADGLPMADSLLKVRSFLCGNRLALGQLE
jgi:hypothetical protein